MVLASPVHSPGLKQKVLAKLPPPYRAARTHTGPFEQRKLALAVWQPAVSVQLRPVMSVQDPPEVRGRMRGTSWGLGGDED